MSDRDEPLVVDETSSADRPLVIPSELPILPLRDTVLFPNSFMPLAVAREASVRLIDEATSMGRMIGVFTQREASVEEPIQDEEGWMHVEQGGGVGEDTGQREDQDPLGA